MSKPNAKKIIREEKKKTGFLSSIPPFFSWLGNSINHAYETVIPPTYWGYSWVRHVIWFVLTTGMITALPLMFEVKREQMIEEMESMQIAAAMADGKTPQELANAGLTGAIAPKVL